MEERESFESIVNELGELVLHVEKKFDQNTLRLQCPHLFWKISLSLPQSLCKL